MPSKSPKQHRFMEAIAHDPAFAQRAGVPQSVGQDFVQADTAQRPKNVLTGKTMNRLIRNRGMM